MIIGKDKIREIVERTDIVQVIGRSVELKRSGRSFKGLCPFHGERTPSFYVTPERQSYKCFGCQKSGDAIQFVMEYEGKDFVTAVRSLAAEVGITIEVEPEQADRLKERRELLWVCEVAQAFFAKILEEPKGEKGRAHLLERGISDTTKKAAGLGYAPLSWNELRDHLARLQVPLQAAERAGLLSKAQDGDRHYDVFRGRLMIPIRDPDGRVIAFGGRVVEGEDDRKYINTRETSLYTKGRVLYGLDLARESIRKAQEVILCEGYFDAIALHEAGLKTAVALCSTALTQEHLQLIKRLEVLRVKLLLDGDEAGRKGAVRLAGPLLASGLATKVVALPDGHDPDTFLRAEGVPGFRRIEAEARALSAFVIARARKGKERSYEGKTATLRELAEIVDVLPEGAARSLFLSDVAQALGLRPSELTNSFRPAKNLDQTRAAPGSPPLHPSRPKSSPPPKRVEQALVAWLFAYPELRHEFAPEAAKQLSHGELRELAFLLAEGSVSDDEILAPLDVPPEERAPRAAEGSRRPSPRQGTKSGNRWPSATTGGTAAGGDLGSSSGELELFARLSGIEEETEKTELSVLLEETKRKLSALQGESDQVRRALRGEVVN